MHKDRAKTETSELKGRALEVYLDLCRQVDQMTPGTALPSLRALQQQYTAGQQTVQSALAQLAKTRPLLRRPYRKARLFPRAETETSPHWVPRYSAATTLALSSTVAAAWQPVIDRFNENSRRMVKPHYVDTLPQLIELAMHGKADFVLFHTNPISNGVLGNTLPFVDLKEFVRTIRAGDFYPKMMMIDPGNRQWGISATLTMGVIFGNRRFGRLPCRNLAWPELLPHLRKIGKDCPGLLYPFGFNGYSTFLMQNGVSMIDAASGRICFDRKSFAGALLMLKDILDEKIAPLFSDTYYDHSSLRWFESGKIAAREIFSSSVRIFSGLFPDYDILPTPAARGARRILGSEFFSICADSINYGTAWDFINFALSPAAQQLLVAANTAMPVRRHVQPPYMNREQFEVFAAALEHSRNPVEDYYLPIRLRLIIETGVDRWNKFGGDIDEFLHDLEESCRQRLLQTTGADGIVPAGDTFLRNKLSGAGIITETETITTSGGK